MSEDVILAFLTFGPLGMGVILILIAHDKMRSTVREIQQATTDPWRKKLYDWLYIGFWTIVGTLLLSGGGYWIYANASDSSSNEAYLIRGVFTKVHQNMSVATESGRLLLSREPRARPGHQLFNMDSVYWIYNTHAGTSMPVSAEFIFYIDTEQADGSAKETILYCVVEFELAGLNSETHEELGFDSERKMLWLSDNEDLVFPCNHAPRMRGARSSTPKRNFVERHLIGEVRAEEWEFVENAVREALNSNDALTRHEARLHLRDTYGDDPAFLNDLILDVNVTYRERVGAMWALSRVKDMPREDMFEEGIFAEDIWRTALTAAIDEDEAIRESGKSFLINFPNAKTTIRILAFGELLATEEEAERFNALLGDIRYYRGVSILVADEEGWRGPRVSEALKEMTEAEGILGTLVESREELVDKDEYAKTLFGVGWSTAVVAEEDGEGGITKSAAKESLQRFLHYDRVSARDYRYSWQKHQAERYLKTQSLEEFLLF